MITLTQNKAEMIAEKERETRNANIVADYRQLTEAEPTASANKKLTAIASHYGLSIVGVKKIIEANGLYEPKARKAQ